MVSSPSIPENGTSPPRRKKNIELRSREHLLTSEVDALLDAAKQSRQGLRNSTLILLGYRHGLRVGELVSLRWDQIDWSMGTIHINRLKRGVPSTHPLRGPELRALRQLQQKSCQSVYIFSTSKGMPLGDRTIRKIVAEAGVAAGLSFPVHPHMLRHACGYYLACHGHDTRAIQDYLGHRKIAHTVRYTALAPDRFKKFWED